MIGMTGKHVSTLLCFDNSQSLICVYLDIHTVRLLSIVQMVSAQRRIFVVRVSLLQGLECSDNSLLA